MCVFLRQQYWDRSKAILTKQYKQLAVDQWHLMNICRYTKSLIHCKNSFKT